MEKMMDGVLVNGMSVMVHDLEDCAKFYVIENDRVDRKVAAWAAGAVFKDTKMLNLEVIGYRETLPTMDQLQPISPKMAEVLTTLLNGEDEGFGCEGSLENPVSYPNDIEVQ